MSISAVSNKNFSGNNESNKAKRNENFLMAGALLTTAIGIGIDIFDKSGKINKAIPYTLDAVGSIMFIASLLPGLNQKKSEK